MPTTFAASASVMSPVALSESSSSRSRRSRLCTSHFGIPSCSATSSSESPSEIRRAISRRVASPSSLKAFQSIPSVAVGDERVEVEEFGEWPGAGRSKSLSKPVGDAPASEAVVGVLRERGAAFWLKFEGQLEAETDQVGQGVFVLLRNERGVHRA